MDLFSVNAQNMNDNCFVMCFFRKQNDKTRIELSFFIHCYLDLLGPQQWIFQQLKFERV